MKTKIICLVVVLFARLASATVLDAPHNLISCSTCHSYSLWWQYSPTSQSQDPDHTAIVDAVCMTCHNGGSGIPAVATHASTVMNSNLHGIWGVGCTSCHNPHYQEQLHWVGSTSVPYLVTGVISGLTYDESAGLSTISYGEATENLNWPPEGSQSTDVDWGNKSLANAGRGLILVQDRTKTLNTFSILSATASQIVVQGALDPNSIDPSYVNPQTKIRNSATCNTFGLIYGQLIKKAIANRDVKFFDPNGGFVVGGAGATGICQVCHTRTAHFTNSGELPAAADSHTGRETGNCTTCHKHNAGFKGTGHDNTSFAWAGNCASCHDPNHTVLSIASEVHGRSCGLCHIDLAGGGPRKDGDTANGMDGSAVDGTNASSCVDCHLNKLLLTGGGIHHQSLHGYAAAGDCTQCHIDEAGRLAAPHAVMVTADDSCSSCHGATAGTARGMPVSATDNKIHDACTTCHETSGALRPAYGKATAMPMGGGRCTNCHGSYFTGHSHSHTFDTVASCQTCHSAVSAPFEASGQVHGALGCQTCHSAARGILVGSAAGKTAGATCQTCHPDKHDTDLAHDKRVVVDRCAACHAIATAAEIDALHNDCATCHGYAGIKLDPAMVASAIAAGKGASGRAINCQTCHVGNDTDAQMLVGALHHKAPLAQSNTCVACHPAVDHSVMVAATPACTAVCHPGTAGTAGGMTVSPTDGTIHDSCRTCHVFGGVYRGRLVDFTNQKGVIGSGKLPEAGTIGGKDGGGACTVCHTAATTSPTAATLAPMHHANVIFAVDAACLTCHPASDVVGAVHSNKCTLCHLDPDTGNMAMRLGADGDARLTDGLTSASCTVCHDLLRFSLGGIHHDTSAAANNNCALTCHTAVDHSATVAVSPACASCHAGTVGTASGVPISLTDAAIHDACRTCHTFDVNKRGTLVSFTNSKGVNGTGPLPADGGTCQACHTAAGMSAYHHASTRADNGQCETCHADPRANWGPNKPGDNVNGSIRTDVSVPRPTQMACVKCHVSFSGSAMTVTKFERSDYDSYRTDWTRSTAHSIPMSKTRINNYGICLSCHDGVKATRVTLWHAHPSQSGNAAWTFYDQGWFDGVTNNAGKTYKRGSGSAAMPVNAGGPGDSAHFIPGRSKRYATDIAPQSGIAGFNIFAPNYGGMPGYINYSYRSNANSPSYGKAMDEYAFTVPAYDTPAFTRIAVPETALLGVPASATLNATTRSVPVFANLTPLNATPQTTDNVKVKSAIYDVSTANVTVVASTSNASGCATLRTWYGGQSYSMTAAQSNCKAIIAAPTAPASEATVDVTTSNSLGLNVMGYRITTPNPGTFAFNASSYSIAETGGTATISVSRTGGTSGTVSVSYATSNGTATAGADFTVATNTLTFNDGETDKTFTVAIINDTTPETNETLTIALANPTGGAKIGEPDTTQLTIVDNDALAGTIAFSAATYPTTEDAGAVTITVNRTGSLVGKVSVDYTTNPFGSTATGGTHYTPTAGTLEWEAGETSKTFSIPILRDPLVAQTTALNLYLNNPTGGAQLGTQNTAAVYITTPAAVTVLNDWSGTQLTGTTGNLSGTFVIGSGSNRLLLVAVSCVDSVGGASGQTFSASYGSKALTQAAIQNSGKHQTWIGYLTEADIASRTGNTVTVTVTGSHDSVAASIASYQNVNQVRPIAASGGTSWSAHSISHTASANPVLVGPGGYSILSWSGVSNGHLPTYYSEDYTKKASFSTVSVSGGIATRRFLSPAASNPSFNWVGFGQDESGAASIITLNSYSGPAAVSLAPTYSVDENAGQALISVSRLGGNAAAAASVGYATAAGGTAQVGIDYAAVLGTLNWGTNDMSDKIFPVPVYPKQVDNVNRTVELALNSPQGAVLGISAGELTIIDDISNIAFTASSYSVSEGDGMAFITVSRTGLSSGGAVGVSYATADGTATAGSDYVATSGTLTWPAGDMTAKIIEIPILDDSVAEGSETVNLSLTAPTGIAKLGVLNTYYAVPPAVVTSTLNITNDDSNLAFKSSASTVNESGGMATITVSRTGLSSGAVGVHYATSDGTATAGVDYTAVAGDLAWAANDMADKTFTIPVATDALIEGDETVILTLTDPTGGATLGVQNTAVVTLADDVSAIAFSTSSYNVNENGGAVTITVTRTGGALTGPVSVSYATNSVGTGKATAGVDYAATSGILTWDANDMTAKTFTVPIIDDTVAESPVETVNLVLSNPTGGAILGNTKTALLSIYDDDTTIAFTSSNYSVNETGGTVTITATRAGQSVAGAISVSYATTTGGTAIANTDYTATSGTLTWAAGDMTNKSFQVTINNNQAYAGDRTVNLALTAPTGGAKLGAIATAVLTISDDEQTGLAFSASSYSVNESVGTATITVSRLGSSSGAITVQYQTANILASYGSDYLSAYGLLSWEAGDMSDKTFTVTILNDTVAEGTWSESVQLTLYSPTGGAGLGAQSTATLWISDDDTNIALTTGTYSVTEDGGAATITASRTGFSTGTVCVTYSAADGSALVGTDYTATSGTLCWADGDMANKTFQVPIIDDTVVEANETINVSLSNPTGSATLGSQSTAVLTIVDQDTRAIAFSAATYVANEDGGTATITVRRTGGPSAAPVSVHYATDTKNPLPAASVGSDYTAVSGDLTWAADDVSDKTFTVPIIDDSLCEPSSYENVGLVLSSPSGDVVLGSQKTAKLIISDNDANIVLTASSYSGNENGGTVTITAYRIACDTCSMGPVSANYATTSGGTATAGVDYIATSGTLSWGDGDFADKTFAITIHNDSVKEGSETVNMALSAPTGGVTLGSPSAAVLTIVDDD